MTTVSKLFRDARFEELCKENAQLRLQLFWKDHNVQMLKTAMDFANSSDKSPKCNCLNCALCGRMDEDDVYDDAKKCAFTPWFEAKIAECGLTYGYENQESTEQEHMSNKGIYVCNIDCHLVKDPTHDGDWGSFTYGSRLWKAKTVNDPELKKLEKLFELLEPTFDDE